MRISDWSSDVCSSDLVNGYTLDKAGALLRFNALLIDERGRVKQLLKPGDKREPVKFKTDARGQTLLPGLIDAHGHVMALGRQTPEIGRAPGRERGGQYV